MKEIRTFENSEFGELKVLVIEGKNYFPATACAKKLGYSNPYDAINQHCRALVKREVIDSIGRKQQVNFISEGDLYRLIIHSRLPAAERFEKWVFDEVLPTIRRMGGYMPDIQGIVRDAVKTTVSEALRTVSKNPVPVLHKRLSGKNAGIIALLSEDIRYQVDCMLDSRAFTYAQISMILLQNYGIRVGKSSVARYAKKVGKAGGVSYTVPTWEQIMSIREISMR